ncbi:MAG: hypothetical protein PQJ60_04780, partial [Spirochaetales bacterium]|nr:hypothetical protein [Spirochaetales bacterium]
VRDNNEYTKNCQSFFAKKQIMSRSTSSISLLEKQLSHPIEYFPFLGYYASIRKRGENNDCHEIRGDIRPERRKDK